MESSNTFAKKNEPFEQKKSHSQERLSWLVLFFLLLSFYIPYYLLFVMTDLHWSLPPEIIHIGMILAESVNWIVLIGGGLAIALNVIRLGRYFLNFGLPKMSEIKSCIELRKKSKGKSDLLDRLTFTMLIVFLGAVGFLGESQLLVNLFIVLIVYDVIANIFLFLPPAVVFLTTSRTDKIIQNINLKALSYPVAILANDKSPEAKVPFFPEYSIFRASPAILGPELLNRLLKMSRIILFDSRGTNDPALTEANIIFANKLEEKTVFIVNDKIENQVVDEVLKNYRVINEPDRLNRILSSKLITEEEVTDVIGELTHKEELVEA